MGKIEKAGIKGQKDGISNAQSQTHSGGSVNQPTGAMKVASGNTSMKSPKTAGGTGQERVGHKYVKREWMPTAQKWKYWYEAPSGEYKYPSWEAKHDRKGVKPVQKDELAHVQDAERHYRRHISLLENKIKHASTVEEEQKLKDELEDAKDHLEELEETADELIYQDAAYKDQKFPDEAYKPRALSMAVNQYSYLEKTMERLLENPRLTAKDRAELRGVQAEASTMKEYMTELSRQIEYQEMIYGHDKPMTHKVSKAKTAAEKRLELAKQEQESIRNLQHNMFSEVDTEGNKSFQRHIDQNVRNFFPDRSSVRKKNYAYKQNEQLEALNKVISDEDIGGVLHGHLDRDRNRLFLIQPSGGLKIKKVEDNLRKIKSEIANNLEIPQKSIQIVRPTNNPGMIGISVPKGDEGLTLVGLKSYLPKVKRHYDQNPVANPYFLGMKMDQTNRRLRKEPLMVNLIDTHVFGGGMTGAGKSNNILLDIIAQKYIGRDVHSVIIDSSSYGEMQLMAEKLPNVHFVGEEKKAHQTLYAIYNEIKRRNDLTKEPDKIPEGGFPEIRLYMDEINDLINNLNTIKRSKMFEGQLDGVTLIKNIARMGRKANVHIISYGQNSKLEEIPSELRTQSIRVGMYSAHTRMAGMPEGQEYVTKFGHMISGTGSDIQESVQANVHSQDLAKILGVELREKSSEKELFKNILRDKNVYYNVSKDLSEEEMTKVLPSPMMFSLFALKSQHRFQDSGKARRENDYRTSAAIPADLKKAADQYGHSLNYNEIKSNFKAYFDKYSKTPAKKRKTNGQIRQILLDVWKRHPDTDIQNIARQFYTIVDNDLNHLPKIDKFDSIIPKPEKTEVVKKKETKQKKVQKEVKKDVKKREASKKKVSPRVVEKKPVEQKPVEQKPASNKTETPVNKKIPVEKPTSKKVEKPTEKKTSGKVTNKPKTSSLSRNILSGINKNSGREFMKNLDKVQEGKSLGDSLNDHLIDQYYEGFHALGISDDVKKKLISEKININGNEGTIQNHLIIKYVNDQMKMLKKDGHKVPEGAMHPEYDDENFYSKIDAILGEKATQEIKQEVKADKRPVKGPKKTPKATLSDQEVVSEGPDTKKKEKVQETQIKGQSGDDEAQIKRLIDLQGRIPKEIDANYIAMFDAEESMKEVKDEYMQNLADDINTGLDPDEHFTVEEIMEVIQNRG